MHIRGALVFAVIAVIALASAGRCLQTPPLPTTAQAGRLFIILNKALDHVHTCLKTETRLIGGAHQGRVPEGLHRKRGCYTRMIQQNKKQKYRFHMYRLRLLGKLGWFSYSCVSPHLPLVQPSPADVLRPPPSALPGRRRVTATTAGGGVGVEVPGGEKETLVPIKMPQTPPTLQRNAAERYTGRASQPFSDTQELSRGV